jgi:hypothetical protein
MTNSCFGRGRSSSAALSTEPMTVSAEPAPSHGRWSHEVPTSIDTSSKTCTIIAMIEHVPMEVGT